MVAIVALFAALYPYLKEIADLEVIKARRGEFESFYADNPATVIALYLFGYIAVAALSLPGAAILTLLAGAIFGVAVGSVVVSFASTIGATLAFLVARFLLGKTLQAKYGDKLRRVNEGVQKEGKFYLFTMRLIPAFPFFLINILMGLTPLRVGAFYWVSQLGMLPGTIVYVNAGTQLAKIDSLGGILSPGLIASFVALGLFPLAAKKIIGAFRARGDKAQTTPPPPPSSS